MELVWSGVGLALVMEEIKSRGFCRLQLTDGLLLPVSLTWSGVGLAVRATNGFHLRLLPTAYPRRITRIGKPGGKNELEPIC